MKMGTKRADALISEMLSSGRGLFDAVDVLADREASLREGFHSSYTSEHELMRDVLGRMGFVPVNSGPGFAEDALQGIERYERDGAHVEIDMNPDGEFRGKFTYHGAAGSHTGYGHKQLSDLLRGV